MVRLWILFFLLGCVKADEFVLGNDCDFESHLPTCNDQFALTPNTNDPCESSGTIETPNYPFGLFDSSLAYYNVQLTSCPGSAITLELYHNTVGLSFQLGSSGNSFTVGDGTNVGSNAIPPAIFGSGDGSNELPGSADSYNFNARANQMWIKFSATEGGASFKISYTITMNNISIDTFNDKTGQIESSHFTNGADQYPVNVEYRYLIDVTDAYYSDLLLTVNHFNITGTYDFGDYVRIGPGLNIDQDNHGALLSWSLNAGTKFLIDGSTAYVVFKSSKTTVTDGYSGFSISYETIDKNLTTPAPPTTTAAPMTTPIPVDFSKIRADVVFLNFYEPGEQNTSAIDVMIDILNNYKQKQEWNLTVELSPESVLISNITYCYSGWKVNRDTCAQVIVTVLSFKTDGSSTTFAFQTRDIENAIRESTYYKQTVTLPSDITNIYIWAICIAALIAAGTLMGCLYMWRLQIQSIYNDKKKYQDLRGPVPEPVIGIDVTRAGHDRRVDNAYINETFVPDDGIYDGDGTFDPDNRKIYSSGKTNDFPVPSPPQDPTFIYSSASSVISDYDSPSESIYGGSLAMGLEIQAQSEVPTRSILKKTVVPALAQSSPTMSPNRPQLPIMDYPTEDIDEIDLYNGSHTGFDRPKPSSDYDSPSESIYGGSLATGLDLQAQSEVPTRSILKKHVVPALAQSSLAQSSPAISPNRPQLPIMDYPIEDMDEIDLYDNGSHTGFDRPKPIRITFGSQNVFTFEEDNERGSIGETHL